MDNSQHGNKTRGLADSKPEEKEESKDLPQGAAAKDGAEDVKVSREEYVEFLIPSNKTHLSKEALPAFALDFGNGA